MNRKFEHSETQNSKRNSKLKVKTQNLKLQANLNSQSKNQNSKYQNSIHHVKRKLGDSWYESQFSDSPRAGTSMSYDYPFNLFLWYYRQTPKKQILLFSFFIY